MPVHSKFEEKIDVLDLLIDVLKDHEENLSEIIGKFDETHQKMGLFAEKLSLLYRVLERLEGLKVNEIVKATGINGPLARVRCDDWATFKTAAQGALLVTFEVSEEKITVFSITDLFVFMFSSDIPVFMGVMSEGVKQWMRKILKTEEGRTASFSFLSSESDEAIYENIVNPERLRRWLSSELGMPEDKIVHGKVLC
mgnify:CR=1 FL=1